MNALKQIITWTSAGFLLAMMAGTPAVADDTELLRVAPLPSEENKPRILFIIDTSTSMNSSEDTLEQYVTTEAYSGQCDPNRTYWLDTPDGLPQCGSSGEEEDEDEDECEDEDGGSCAEQSIDKDNFFCQTALQQMAGLGSVTTIFAQYRDGGPSGQSSGPKKWQSIAPGYNSEPVECYADSGVHGDGSSATLVYAKAGSNINPWYTDNPAEEIDWASIGGGQTYTFYDGNYLNYRVSAPIVSESRIDIVKQVLTTVFQSVSGVIVGVERFNDSEGGTIIQGLIDIDTNRAEALAAVASLTPNDHTTIAESLYESALYWLGEPAEFAEIDGDNENFTDHDILVDPSAGAGAQA